MTFRPAPFGNSHVKDYHDIHALSRVFGFDGQLLVASVASTFRHRLDSLSDDMPLGLEPPFFEDVHRVVLWHNFVDQMRLDGAPRDFTAVGESLRGFLGPVIAAASAGAGLGAWEPGGPWR